MFWSQLSSSGFCVYVRVCICVLVSQKGLHFVTNLKRLVPYRLKFKWQGKYLKILCRVKPFKVSGRTHLLPDISASWTVINWLWCCFSFLGVGRSCCSCLSCVAWICIHQECVLRWVWVLISGREKWKWTLCSRHVKESHNPGLKKRRKLDFSELDPLKETDSSGLVHASRTVLKAGCGPGEIGRTGTSGSI